MESVCAELAGTPDPQTIRGPLNEQLRVEELPELEKKLNQALAAEVPPRVRRHAQAVAIDYHDRPYYGKGEQQEELWVRGKAKEGTTRFYRVATAYVILKGVRVTLALHFVLPAEDTVSVLDCLLKRVKAQGLRLSCLLLDKGFESVAVMEYLTRQGQPVLIACTVRGTTGGTRALCQGRRSDVTQPPFQGPHGSLTAAVLVGRVVTTARRTGRPPGTRRGCCSGRFTSPSLPAMPVTCTGGGLALKPVPVAAAGCGAGPRLKILPIASC